MAQRNTSAKIQKLVLSLAFAGLMFFPLAGNGQAFGQNAAAKSVPLNKAGSSARAAMMNAALVSLNERIANEYGFQGVNVVFGKDTEQYDANGNKMGLRGMGEVYTNGKSQGRISYDISFDASEGRITSVYYHLVDYKK